MKNLILILALATVAYCWQSNDDSSANHLGGHRHHWHRDPPEFLKNVSKQARQDFHQIFRNFDDLTKREIREKVHTWAQKQGKDVENVSKQARQDFHQIFRNFDDLTKREIREKVHTWAQKQGKDVEKQILDFEAKLDHFIVEAKENLTRTLEILPSAMEKVQEIRGNEDLTRHQKREQINDFLDTLDEQTARAARFLMFQSHRHGGPHHFRGGPHHRGRFWHHGRRGHGHGRWWRHHNNTSDDDKSTSAETTATSAVKAEEANVELTTAFAKDLTTEVQDNSSEFEKLEKETELNNVEAIDAADF